MSKFVTRFLKDESGATAIEYGLIIALMATIILAAFALLGPSLTKAFGRVATKLDAA
ncbi:MAG: Flp family type IVb pilin [Burkholderiales bacterium]|jgi:pilus assembly protein Flp/PilA|nr:Flp family type IVb pilin [Burkholderiales bacterium]